MTAPGLAYDSDGADLRTISGMTDERFDRSVVASEFFTKGSCHQLAMALVSLIEDATFVAIYDHDPQLPEPRMVHAAALVGDRVIDIEDFADRDTWIERWSDQARVPMFVEYDPGELPFEYTTEAHRSYSEMVARRLSDYWSSDLDNATVSSVRGITP